MSHRSNLRFGLMALMVVSATAMPVYAEEAEAKPTGFWERDTLTGNWSGFRTTMQDRGIDLNATEIFDTLGNPVGGTTQGAVIEGLFMPTLDIDFAKLAGENAVTSNLTLHASALQIHGRGISASNLNNNIATATGIEAERATRLFELWVEKNFMDNRLSVRAGQLAADAEFIGSEYSALFMNSAFGWPSSMATNLPAGGPGYPYATPGLRVRVGDPDALSFQTAVFNGDPSGGPGPNSSQSNNANGVRFPVDDEAFIMAELDFAHKGEKVSLPGTYKVGGWYHTGSFNDLRYGTDGLSLADGGSNGVAISHQDNYGFYGVVDQMLWRPGEENSKGLAGFARFLWFPNKDRSTISYQVDAGLNLIGIFPGRADDTVGVTFTYLPVSEAARGFDRDTNALNGTSAPVRDAETVIEMTYQAPITPWLTLQPDFQYIIHPGAYVQDPRDTLSGTKAVEDAAIIGLRAVLKL